MIFKRPDAKDKDGKGLFDPGRKKRMNRKLNKFFNYYDLKSMIQAFASSEIPEMKELSRTLISWREEIINSFIVVKRRHTVDKDTGQVVSDIKLNNGLMENRNSIIKMIKKAATGYTNWDRFRNRCLYVLRRNSYPLLNPVIPPKKVTQ